MGVSQAASHVHCSFSSVQSPELDAFVNKFMFGMDTNTSILETAATNGVGARMRATSLVHTGQRIHWHTTLMVKDEITD